MESQKRVFLHSEGDNYFRRNNHLYTNGLAKKEELAHIVRSLELHPKNVLEIGCANGIILDAFYKMHHSNCYGIDPSMDAILDGRSRFPALNLEVGTADALPYDDNTFDLIIFGFSLYLCDRNDLFKIAYEADRCLQNGGSILIKDFYPPFPLRNTYSHLEGVYSYKMNYPQIFLWNPAYQEIYLNVSSQAGIANRDVPDEKIAISVLRKIQDHAYPEAPFRNGLTSKK